VGWAGLREVYGCVGGGRVCQACVVHVWCVLSVRIVALLGCVEASCNH